MWLRSAVPKKFLFKFPLKLGAIIVSIFMCVIMAVCAIAITIDLFSYSSCDTCGYRLIHNATAFGINGALYCIAMFLVNIWFLWGVKQEKSSVVLSWVVISAMWWFQTVCFVLILIFLYSKEVSLLAWIVALVFGILAFALILYGVLVGLGYWFELKGVRLSNEA